MNLTIVIVSYRYGHLAAHCIESIRSQSQQPDKILFIDDGVGDCSHLPSLYPELEFVLRPKNLGVVDNFQDVLLNRVQTDWVMFVGADNWFSSDAIERITQAAFGVDIVTYDIKVTGDLKNQIKNQYPKEVSSENGDWYWDRSSGHHGSMMYSVLKAREVGGYAHGGGVRSDEDAVLYRRMLNAGAKRYHVSEAFLFYRRHSHNFYKYPDIDNEEINMDFKLTLPDAAAKKVKEAYEAAQAIVEYGTGGSTFLAARAGKQILAVESDSEWLGRLIQSLEEKHLSETVKPIWADIGKTKEWGHPVDERKWRGWHNYAIASLDARKEK